MAFMAVTAQPKLDAHKLRADAAAVMSVAPIAVGLSLRRGGDR